MAKSKNGQEPIDEEIRKNILTYVDQHFDSFAAFARHIGINNSTLADIIKRGKNVTCKNKATITAFYGEKILKKENPTGLRAVNLGPKMTSERLEVLKNKFGVGSDLVISAVRELVNTEGAEAARNAIRRIFPQDITDLYIAVKAISSEPALESARTNAKDVENNVFNKQSH